MTERYAVDSSVVIKWFKRGEIGEKESLILLNDILGGKLGLILSEWRALGVEGVRLPREPWRAAGRVVGGLR